MPPRSSRVLHTPSVESENDRAIAGSQAREIEKGLEKEEDTSKAHAARMRLYGRLTREITPWQPAKLLKRFGSAGVSSQPLGITPSVFILSTARERILIVFLQCESHVENEVEGRDIYILLDYYWTELQANLYLYFLLPL